MPDGVTYISGSKIRVLTEDMEQTLEVDDTGVTTADVSYTCAWGDSVRLVSALHVHPDFPWLTKEKATVERLPGSLARVQVHFKGVDPDAGSSGSGDDNEEEGVVTTYNVEQSATTEPIETNKRFTTFAGFWDEPVTWVNGAKFDIVTGRFLGFNGRSAGLKRGVVSFLSPSLVYTRVKVMPRIRAADIGVDMTALGKIDEPPRPATGSILPRTPPGRNYLKIGCSVEYVGKGARVTERWQLSGENGWDSNIYESSTGK